MDVARERVATASRRIAERGLVIGTGGNVSERVGEDFAITGTGTDLEAMGPREVSIVDGGGRLVHGELEPSSELFLHLGIYERYGAGAVVHTHSPMATAIACALEDELPSVHYQMLMFGGAVRIAPYRTFGTRELADAVLDALEGKTAALMANHGAIVYAHDLEHAVQSAQLLEWACSVYWHAAALGPPRVLDQESLDAVVEQLVARNYGSTRKGEA